MMIACSGRGFKAGCGLVVLSLLSLCGAELRAQVVTQHIQAVYGGRISTIAVATPVLTTNVSTVYISTESANSIFYATVDHSATGKTNIFSAFSVVPDFDANANYGVPNDIAVHRDSGRLYVAHESGLLSCDTSAGSLTTNISGSISTVHIRGSNLFAVGGIQESRQLYFGTLNSTGALTQAAGSPLTFGTGTFFSIASHPRSNSPLYILESDGSAILKTTDNYDQISGATTTTPMTLPLSMMTNWSGSKVMSVAPDGRIFVGGQTSTNKAVVYTDDNGTSWTEVETGQGGTTGPNISFGGTPSSYHVYFGTAMSLTNGIAGSWTRIPSEGVMESNPNDGCVRPDPNDSSYVYLTSDQGIAASTNSAAGIFEIDQGVEAVQIQDFDMTDAKDVAWTASKSGIRRASGFQSTPTWSDAMFPNGDGSLYYSVAVNRSYTNGLHAYAGNVVVYSTIDGGTNWSSEFTLEAQGFTNCFVSSIEIVDGTFVYVGVCPVNSPFGNPSQDGALYVSEDDGVSWKKYLVGATGVDVNDIVVTTNSTGRTAYIAAAFDTNSASGGGVYTVTSLTTNHFMTNGYSIRDLALDDSNGVYAAGMSTCCGPVIYYKAPDATNTWTTLTTAGLPTNALGTVNPNGRGPVITVGEDASSNQVLYVAIGTSLYYIQPQGGTNWQTSTGLTYPNGTQINVLYWDDLMVGTDIGLYSQTAPGAESATDRVPVYRLYSYGAAESTFEHLWTTSETEKDVLDSWPSWEYEGIAWYAYTNSESGTTPLYRLYEPTVKQHHYTISATEYVALTNTSWNGEGIQYYVYASQETGTLPAYRFYNATYQLHHFTIDENEMQSITNNPSWGYVYEGVGYYVFQTSTVSSVKSVVPAEAPSISLGVADVTETAEATVAAPKEATPAKGADRLDYDGDGVADEAVYDELTGNWYVSSGSRHILWGAQWGGPGMVGVQGDYDGDGLGDLAVYEKASGCWYVRTVDGRVILWGEKWGGPGMVPVSGNFDAEPADDLAVYHDETGQWFIRTLDGEVLVWALEWGGAGLEPAAEDFDGDGITDLVVVDPETGLRYVRSVDGRVLSTP